MREIHGRVIGVGQFERCQLNDRHRSPQLQLVELRNDSMPLLAKQVLILLLLQLVDHLDVLIGDLLHFVERALLVVF